MLQPVFQHSGTPARGVLLAILPILAGGVRSPEAGRQPVGLFRGASNAKSKLYRSF
jgi:hypothetical protein